MTHDEFKTKKQKAVNLIKELGSFAIEVNDMPAFVMLMKAKGKLENAGNKVSDTVKTKD